MTKIDLFHTNSTEYSEVQRTVHHDHDTCSDGKIIKPEHRESGIAVKPRCKERLTAKSLMVSEIRNANT